MSDARPPGDELYVQLGVLDALTLQLARETQREFEINGVKLGLDEVILNLGLAERRDVARVKAHNGPATLLCPRCRSRFEVPAFNARRTYKCETCLAALELTAETRPPTPPPQPSDPFAGRTVGAYRVLRRLGKGGMGVVYLGEHVALGEKVAVKFLTEEMSRQPEIEARFRREGQASARLEHPNIAATLEMGQDGKHAYIVTEFLESGSLEDLVRKEGRLSPERTVAILADVLSGLQHAHDRGVVHRDIKPANVLLTRGERAKVIDFGLAKDAEAKTLLTLDGTVMGTPAYMSPEQAEGQRGGPPSDIYSCGILGFYMLTGRKPFEGKKVMDTLLMQVKEPLPSIRDLNPSVPEALERALRKLTEKDPRRRPASAVAAIEELRRAMGQAPEETSEPHLRRPWRNRWVWVAAAAALALAAYLLARR